MCSCYPACVSVKEYYRKVTLIDIHIFYKSKYDSFLSPQVVINL